MLTYLLITLLILAIGTGLFLGARLQGYVAALRQLHSIRLRLFILEQREQRRRNTIAQALPAPKVPRRIATIPNPNSRN